jgi:MoaA/NifB/PqqE/SkfB family radical SAM enzyme
MSGPEARGDLRLETLTTCIEDAVELGYRQLAVSGGEPLLYKALSGLLSYARRLGMLTSITSNGMLITAERWESLAHLVDVLAISIDGSPLQHDQIRCHEGAFASTTANLEVIRSSGVPFGFIFTLTQFNVDDLEFVIRLAAEQGARNVQVHPLTLHGRAASTMPSERPDGIELLAAMIEAIRLGNQHGIAVHVDAVVLPQLMAYRGHFVPLRPVRRLADIAPVLIVEADGTVVPMTHEVNRTLKLGSLTDARLVTLAREWLSEGRGDVLADACERTWEQLSTNDLLHAVYWYDEVAART